MGFKDNMKKFGRSVGSGISKGVEGVERFQTWQQERKEQSITKQEASLKRGKRRMSLLEEEEKLRKRREKMSGGRGGFGGGW